MQGQAGERRADVYVGVDVFARGDVVGGRFDTNKVGGGTGGRGWGPVFSWTFRSPLTSRERQAAVNFPRVGKLRHQEPWVTCPGAQLCLKVLTSSQVFMHKGTCAHRGLTSS